MAGALPAEPPPVVAAVGTFAAFAAPTVLSGRATFDGYIKLDDTATYFAMTDRVMEHAQPDRLAPSTYEATLATTVKLGYPTGSLMPVGIGHWLLSYDIAWLFQPYLAFLAAMLALTLYAILERLIYRPVLRAAAAFVAAQPAILYGYSLWGGVKELAGAWLLALIAALAPRALLAGRSARAGIPLAAAVATLVCVLSLPGGAWSTACSSPERCSSSSIPAARCWCGQASLPEPPRSAGDSGDRRRGRLAAARRCVRQGD